MATPRPPAPIPTPKRYSLTFKDHHDQAHGFHDCDTPAEARAWLDTMLGKAAGKPTPTAPVRPTAAPPVRLTREQAEARIATMAFPPHGALASAAPAPTPTPPRPGTLAARLLASLREAGPADVATLRQRHPAVGGSAVRGRLSELAAAGWVVCRDDTYSAAAAGEPAPTPPATAPAPDPAALHSPAATAVLVSLGRMPMRLGRLAQYASRRVVDLVPVVNALVASGQVVDNGGLFRLATSPTPPEAAVKSSPMRAAPSPPPARKGKP